MGKLHWHRCTYSKGSSNKIFVRTLVLILARLFLLNGYYLAMAIHV